MDFIFQPWPWFAAGPLIALTLFLYFYFGKNFGVSTNFETVCTLVGAGKFCDYFDKDWKEKDYGIYFIVGLLIGGFITAYFLIPNQQIDLNPKTVSELANIGFVDAGKSYLPDEIYSNENVFTVKGFLILLLSGVFIGFGTRYAGGCTSGHSITGLSSFQLPSLLATIGFFAGGIIMTWFLIPLLF
jgi:uncharacterized membrane protein YedE/YeeE